MPISIIFQERFSELVRELDCPRKDLSAKLNVNPEIISKALNYGILPRPRALIKIADSLNISLEYLLGISDNEVFFKAENRKTFFERLEILRESKNLTYYQLGKELHIAPSYFANWHKQNYIPTLEFLTLLSDYFEVSLDYLLGRTDEK